ncbi:MAG: hypothetical protein M0Z63_00795 [Actinomycetota bacterium]|nr:hypothetical protein [Actinomycetota bacterium]MDA8278962.1 hypothetical protein [Actinomycetota bacterium]
MTISDAPVAATTRRSTSAPDAAMRRLLRVPERKAATNDDAQRLFGTSILISALRCVLSYVVFPVLTPVLGTAAGVGPAIGIPIAVLALVFDVRGTRRFWLANHRWRWPITFVYVAVMALVTVLLVGDIAHFA